ncbi:PadR family transcriptional regulator [Leptotrichia massiliensis]|uniref:PadR family transcriptional regulator n=1 Tax=Leptotrichia massiliensis TaxID=1852388 RepID=UPI0008D9E892|nr:PadR family transcriptional regulator [Leptotrichia massiliensis]
MDKIILGILMLRRMTAYELRNTIRDNFKSMCSDSLGSIQAALKKLLSLKMVTFEELVEKGVNKKRYAITDAGEKILMEWIKIPIDISKTKNIDAGKLLFMGYISKNEQKNLINKIILSLEEEYTALKNLKESINFESERLEIENYLLTDTEYQKRIKNLNKKNNISENIKEISKFTLASLDYGIDAVDFNIRWFKKLKKKYRL